jgi:hypothetical protein
MTATAVARNTKSLRFAVSTNPLETFTGADKSATEAQRRTARITNA